MKSLLFTLRLLLVIVLIISCSKEKISNQSQGELDEITVTGGVSDVTSTSAKLSGFCNIDFNSDNLQYGLLCSTDEIPTFGNSIVLAGENINSNNEFFVFVNGLVSGSLYYYCSYVIFDDIVYKGLIKSFRTKYVIDYNGHDYVDLGLSVNWATINVGASNYWDMGSLYPWGGIDTTNIGSWEEYKYWTGYNSDGTPRFSKYNTTILNGPVDNKTTLDIEDDIAHVKYGGSWRMPTLFESLELRNLCSWKDTIINGIKGSLITSKLPGYTDKSIFLPVRYSDSYWLKTLYSEDPTLAYEFGRRNPYRPEMDANGAYRYSPCAIRPVSPSAEWEDIIITLDVSSVTLAVSNSYKLNTNITSGNINYMFAPVVWSSSDSTVAKVNNVGVVEAVGGGSAVITVFCHGNTAQCKITVSDFIPTYEYVDLGLSVKWSKCNLGAITTEGYGNYYAWGEISPKSIFTFKNYIYNSNEKDYSNYDPVIFSKYVTDGKYGQIDDITILELTDDVAHNLLGGGWRIPTKSEWEELADNCIIEPFSINGINGYKYTSKIPGYTDQSIFLPTAGYSHGRSPNENISEVGYSMRYWSSNMVNMGPSSSITLCAWSFAVNGCGSVMRSAGMPIRPVLPSSNWTGITSIDLDKKTLVLKTEQCDTIRPILKSNTLDYSYFPVFWSSSDKNVAVVNEEGVVYAVNSGTAIINAICNGLTRACVVTVSKHTPFKEAVDLGLSVKWASCNVGAERPEDSGGFYSWGETTIKQYYTEYFSLVNLLGFNSFVNSNNVLKPEYDVAHIKWGGNWRMPTVEEFDELKKNCSFSLIELNGVKGYEVKSKIEGYRDKTIFLPITGYLDGTMHYYSCYYLSSSLNRFPSSIIVFDPEPEYGGTRTGLFYYYGYPVRPVCDW